MANILILYGTTEGHTARIAEHIAGVVKAGGHTVETVNAKRLPADLAIETFDAVIIGASLHIQKHQAEVKAFIKANHDFLRRVPSTFFSVSMSAISSAAQERQAAGYLAEKFVQNLGWQPDRTEIIGGAVPYTRYGFLKRLVMKMIMKKHGSDTDTSRDYEYTDWNAVTRFTEDFLHTLEGKNPKLQ